MVFGVRTVNWATFALAGTVTGGSWACAPAAIVRSTAVPVASPEAVIGNAPATPGVTDAALPPIHARICQAL